MERPIRPFYCVYLLRSTKRRASMYIGSTPNPRRRLRQHNNVSGKGGAHRTTRDNLQPWDMIVTVTGFPSKIAALQFEWAWQHPHLTRHLSKEERVGVLTDTVKRSKGATGARRLARPSRSIQAHMLNLHLLLSVDSFCRWPLSVRFFAKDVFDIWRKWANGEPQLSHKSIPVHLDSAATQEQPTAAPSNDVPPSLQGIDALDITYASFKPHLTKSISLFDSNTSPLACASCRERLKPEQELLLACPNESCNMTAHLSCLAELFLKQEDSHTDIVPTGGHCPSCQTKLNWAELMTELSLRIRGQDSIHSIMKDPKNPASKASTAQREDAAQLAPVSDLLLRDDLNSPQQLADWAQKHHNNNNDDNDLIDDDDYDDDDEFVNLSDVLGEDSVGEEDEDRQALAASKRRKAPVSSTRPQKPSKAHRSKVVISDSEYDEIDEID